MAEATVGKNVDSWCTRCKLMLAHTIEVIKEEKISRVHCNTCNAQHVYRPNPPGKRAPRAAGAASTARAAAARAAKAAEAYETLLAGRDGSTARPYATTERFAESDLIQHPSFGLGVVVKDRGEKKIQVAFPDAERILIHAG